jgi:ubiquinone/menaquinone biosynthesis C-methylase UbiE
MVSIVGLLSDELRSPGGNGPSHLKDWDLQAKPPRAIPYLPGPFLEEMGQPAFDPEKYTAASREAWSEAAKEFADENAARLEPYGAKLLELLELERVRPGACVLDICSGPGEPAISIARRLDGRAKVTGSDFSPEMVRIGAERAAAAGLRNIEFREADAQALPFDARAFDIVTCRFGLMLVAEPPRVAREVERVMKKGGRFGFVVWAAGEKRGPVWTIRQVINELVPADRLPPAPDTHQWGDPSRLRSLMDESELAIRKLESAKAVWSYASPADYWRSMTRGSPMGKLISRLPAEFAPRIESETLERLAGLARPDGSLSLPAEALVVVAQKGMT